VGGNEFFDLDLWAFVGGRAPFASFWFQLSKSLCWCFIPDSDQKRSPPSRRDFRHLSTFSTEYCRLQLEWSCPTSKSSIPHNQLSASTSFLAQLTQSTIPLLGIGLIFMFATGYPRPAAVIGVLGPFSLVQHVAWQSELPWVEDLRESM
jgi:hypothetical protein